MIPQRAAPTDATRAPLESPRGVGLGLRYHFAQELIDRAPAEVAWVEIHPENYVGRGGPFRSYLRQASQLWRFIPHGVSLCFGNTDPYEQAYLAELRTFLHAIHAPFYSDHLCFSSVGNAHLHDLLPFPKTPETVAHAVANIQRLQDALELPIAVENVSYYAKTGHSTMDDIAFIGEVLERADALLLLDVNNVFVNATNHGFDAYAFIDALPLERVAQVHMAGHYRRRSGVVIDTHSEAIVPEVFALFEYALKRIGPVPVLLERDSNFPSIDVLLDEVRALATIYERVTGEPSRRGTSPAREIAL